MAKGRSEGHHPRRDACRGTPDARAEGRWERWPLNLGSQRERSEETQVKRIAIEEAFVTAEIAAEWKKVLARDDVEPGFAKMGESILAQTPGNALLHSRLLDIGKGRIAHMDEVGIDVQVLSLTSPGVQVFAADLATRLAAEANDVLAD